MKKPLLYLILIFFSIQLQAQVVTIPNPVFKDLLVYNASINTNQNQEIEVAEALAVTELYVGSDTAITDLTGLEAFQNLTELRFFNIQVVDLNVNSLANLSQLWIDTASVSNFNVNLPNLQYLIISGLTTPALNVSNLTNLQVLVANSCGITTLDVSGLSHLTTLNCSQNALTSVTLPTTNNLLNYNCSGNQFSSLDLTAFTSLKKLWCGDNPFTALAIANNATLEEIYCNGLALPTIGFQNLPSIKKIDCSDSQLTTIDMSQVPSLQDLKIANNLLSVLNLTNLSNLIKLDCSLNPITGINLAQVPQLKEFYCNNTSIASLDFTAAASLEILSCLDNPMTVIDFTGLANLKQLFFGNASLAQVQNLAVLANLNTFEMSNTTFQTIDISPLQKITRLGIHNTALTTLDFSNNTNINGMYIYIDYNPDLAYMNSNNGKSIYALATGSSYIKHCPNLTSVCTAERNIYGMRYALTNPNNQNNITNPLVLSYCSFAPNGDHNTVTGTVAYDENDNGCDSNDSTIQNVKIKLATASSQNEAFTNANGAYNFYPEPGNYTLSPNIDSNYFTASPASIPVSFANYDNNTITQNFCLAPNGIKNDLEVVLLPLYNFGPGNRARYRLVYKNQGNQTLSGVVNLNFDDTVLNYLPSGFADDTPTTSGWGNLSWNFTNLHPFETRSVMVLMQLNSPMSTIPLEMGDILDFTATINPASGDITPDNNTFNLAETVPASYDPNDKICLEGTTITPDKVGDYLNYVIRFQNTGTAEAHNVVVKDVLDTAKFNMDSFEFTASSHNVVTRIANNTVEFVFEGINLPAEVDDEPNSHGFVAFKIKTKPSLVLGDTVENKAEIYFDFNFPVITNIASTTVSLLGVSDIEDNSVSIAPVPVKSILQIRAKQNITAVELFDIQGRLLQRKSADALQTELDFTGKSNGIYLVKIYTEKGFKVQKVAKE